MSGSWIPIVAIVVSSVVFLAIALFGALFFVRWKRKQRIKNRHKNGYKTRKLAITRQFVPNFQIPDAVPLFIQTTEQEGEEYEPSPQDLVQPTSDYSHDYIDKAASLRDLNHIPRRFRYMSTGNLLDVQPAERRNSSPQLMSRRLSSAEYIPRPGYDERPLRKSVVDMTVPRKGTVPRQRSVSEQDLSKMVERPAKPNSEFALRKQKRGRIKFDVFHNEEEHKLVVYILNALDLPLRNTELLDSFVRLSLKSTTKRKTHAKYQTKLVKKSCNPIFNERHEFGSIRLEDLSKTSLKIKVFHRESFTRNELVGQTLVSLSDPEILGRECVICDLLPARSIRQQEVAGEIMVSVCHHATSAQLKVSVIKVRDLPKPGKAVYVTVQVYFKDQVLYTEEAKPKKSRNGIVYNELFVFDVHTSTLHTLDHFGLLFTAYTRDRLRNKEVIGCVQLSDDAPTGSAERRHWKKVKASPLKSVADWHKFHEMP